MKLLVLTIGFLHRGGSVQFSELCMRVQKFSFGSIRIDGVTYGYDVVIDRGDVRKRKKKPEGHQEHHEHH